MGTWHAGKKSITSSIIISWKDFLDAEWMKLQPMGSGCSQTLDLEMSLPRTKGSWIERGNLVGGTLERIASIFCLIYVL